MRKSNIRKSLRNLTGYVNFSTTKRLSPRFDASYNANLLFIVLKIWPFPWNKRNDFMVNSTSCNLLIQPNSMWACLCTSRNFQLFSQKRNCIVLTITLLIKNHVFYTPLKYKIKLYHSEAEPRALRVVSWKCFYFTSAA